MPFVVSGAVDALDVWTQSAAGDSFAVGEDGPPLWRAVLAADASVAAADLTGAESRLTAARRGLERAESGLAARLDDPDFHDSLRQPPTETSVSIWSGLAQLHLDGTVETEVGGQLIGRTLLGWSGGERTVWQADCTPTQAALHCRTVLLAAESRLVMVRRLSLGLRYAARAAAVLTLPGGPLLALPTVLHYLDAARR